MSNHEASKPIRPKMARPQSGNFKVPTCETVIDLLELKGDALLDAIFAVCHDLFPGWIQDRDAVELERVSGALTNAIFFVTYRNTRKLLRVYGIGADEFIDREKELMWLERLGRLHMGPRLLAVFGNGRFEEYVPSTTLHHEDVRVPETSRQIAQCVARQHALISIYPYPENGQLEIWKTIDKWHSMLARVLPVVKNRNPKTTPILDAFDFDRLAREIEATKAFLTHHINSPVVFGHNDLQYGNILRREGKGSLVLVDFEYSGYNPRGYDIANHFVEWRYDYHGDKAEYMSLPFPTDEEQRVFLGAYLETMKHELGVDTTVDELQREVLAWVMTVHLSWGIWGLIQASQSEIDYDYFSYSMEKLNSFRDEYAKWEVEVTTLST
ncbi:kinase-like domain-containing protein [Gongronella butleri]|nr:kinase-like domain-containing protein [Gongronella butleri]